MDPQRDKVGKLSQGPLSPADYILQADPLFWLCKADELKSSAMALAAVFFDYFDKLRRRAAELRDKGESSIEPNGPVTLCQFSMLAGFAIENLLKALVILDEPQLLSSGNLAGVLTKHALSDLAAKADVPLSPEEDRFCELASSAIFSWGRYPVTTSHKKDFVTEVIVNEDAVRAFEGLFDKLRRHFNERYASRIG